MTQAKLSKRALAFTVGILWGGAVFVVGFANLIWPEYGVAFLNGVSSVYPGYDPNLGGRSVVIGGLYAIFDGAIGGYILGWLYNKFAR